MFRYELAALRFELAMLKLATKARRTRWLTKAGFDPAQPRDDEGRWVDEGLAPEQADGDAIDDANASGGEDLSANSRKGGQGHHYVPKALNGKYPELSDEVKSVFDSAKTGTLLDNRSNRYDLAHRAYNRAVEDAFDRFLQQEGVDAASLSADQARRFVTSILKSNDPRIRRFNMGIQMREIMFRLLRRVPGRE